MAGADDPESASATASNLPAGTAGVAATRAAAAPRPVRLLARIAAATLAAVVLLAIVGGLELAGVGEAPPDGRDETAGIAGGDDVRRATTAFVLVVLALAGALPAAALLVAARLRRRGPTLVALALLAGAGALAWAAAIRDRFDGSWGLVGLLLVYPLALGLALLPASLRHLGVLRPPPAAAGAPARDR